MNSERNRRQCVACGESEPSFIHTVSKNGVFRRLCTDCLLKEHRELFCPVCLIPFVDFPPPNARIVCLTCSSITHLSCSPPPPSSSAATSSTSSAAAASSFTCSPCSDPNFSFFPKSHPRSSDQIGENDETPPLDEESGKALIAAAEIAVVSMNKAVAHLKNEAVKKILEAKMAKMRAKEALANLQDLVIKQKTSENNNPNKRKNSDR